MNPVVLRLDPALPLLQVIALAIAAAGLAFWLYNGSRRGDGRRQWPLLTAIRVLTVSALALLLLNPVLTRPDRRTEKPSLLVLVDSSRSMAVRDVRGKSRFAAARSGVLENEELIRRLSRQYTPVFYSLAETATRQDLYGFRSKVGPSGARTCIGESMAAALNEAETGGGGMLLVSDGRNNGTLDAVSVAREARTRRQPVFTVCLGSETRLPDVALVNRAPQVFAAPGQWVDLTADVTSSGFNGRQAQAKLMLEGHMVASRPVFLDDHRPVPLTFSVRQQLEGTYRYSLQIDPLPREATAANNRIPVLLQVLRSRVRVLVLEGRPSWDAKFLVQALHSDPSVDVDAIYRISPDRFFAVMGSANLAAGDAGSRMAAPAAGGAAPRVHVPSTLNEFRHYDVIVIGKGYEDLLPEAAGKALQAYVADHGGNVIFLRGNPGERAVSVRALEPVQWSSEEIEDLRMQLTEEGRLNPAFRFRSSSAPEDAIQRLPTLISATRVQSEKALAVVLARTAQSGPGESGKEMALLAYQNFGQGKAVSLIGEGLWRWALLPPDLNEYRECYQDFWTQLIHWLVNQANFLPGRDLSLKTDRQNYSPGETVRLLVYARGVGVLSLPPAEILTPDGRRIPASLLRTGGKEADFIGSFRPETPGEYLASLGRSTAEMNIVPFSVLSGGEEEVNTAADPGLMQQIAEAGGGEMLALDHIGDLPEKLQNARMLLRTRTETRTAWDRGWVLAILAGALALEWTLRRRSGML